MQDVERSGSGDGGQGVRSDNYACQEDVFEQVHGAKEADVDSEDGDSPGTKQRSSK